MKHNPGKEIAPGIIVYENVIDNSKDLINLALSDKNGWRAAQIVKNNREQVENHNIRNNMILDVPAIYSNHIEWFAVGQTIWKYGNDYGINFHASFSNMEHLQLLHYCAGNNFYSPHIDSAPGLPRIFSAVLYLNDVDEGGETHFNKLNISVSPKEGRLVLFPANYIYVHEARPPKSCDKFALVTWFNPIL